MVTEGVAIAWLESEAHTQEVVFLEGESTSSCRYRINNAGKIVARTCVDQGKYLAGCVLRESAYHVNRMFLKMKLTLVKLCKSQ